MTAPDAGPGPTPGATPCPAPGATPCPAPGATPCPAPGATPPLPAHGPLRGQRVLVPRVGEAGERIGALVRAQGGAPEPVALIHSAPPLDSRALADAVTRWNAGHYDWLAVTSAQGAHALAEAGARPGGGRIAAVGPATAHALESAGLTPTLVPGSDFTGESLARELIHALDHSLTPAPAMQRDTTAAQGNAQGETLGDAHGEAQDEAQGARVLLPLSEIAEPTLERALQEAGHFPDRVTAYRTVPSGADPAGDAELAARITAALVLSSSGARALAERFAPFAPGLVIAAIGEPTARELTRLGLTPHAIATKQTAAGTVAALAAYFTETPDQPLPPAR